MTLKEVGIVIGKKLETRRIKVIASNNPVIVSFEGTEVKSRRMLISSYGQGKTVAQAKSNYCEKIRGQILVTDAFRDTRKEIQLPPKITVKR